MKTLLIAVLCASTAYAADPTIPVVDPIDTDTPTLAKDVPNVSVRLRAGETAPFDGRLLSLDENLRRGKDAVDCKAELTEAKTNLWTDKATLVTVVISVAVASAGVSAGVTYWALTKK